MLPDYSMPCPVFMFLLKMFPSVLTDFEFPSALMGDLTPRAAQQYFWPVANHELAARLIAYILTSNI